MPYFELNNQFQLPDLLKKDRHHIMVQTIFPLKLKEHRKQREFLLWISRPRPVKCSAFWDSRFFVYRRWLFTFAKVWARRDRQPPLDLPLLPARSTPSSPDQSIMMRREVSPHSKTLSNSPRVAYLFLVPVDQKSWTGKKHRDPKADWYGMNVSRAWWGLFVENPDRGQQTELFDWQARQVKGNWSLVASFDPQMIIFSNRLRFTQSINTTSVGKIVFRPFLASQNVIFADEQSRERVPKT
jgi:hypothetical protein